MCARLLTNVCPSPQQYVPVSSPMCDRFITNMCPSPHQYVPGARLLTNVCMSPHQCVSVSPKCALLTNVCPFHHQYVPFSPMCARLTNVCPSPHQCGLHQVCPSHQCVTRRGSMYFAELHNWIAITESVFDVSAGGVDGRCVGGRSTRLACGHRARRPARSGSGRV